ncbi:hypothetical protein AUJ67_06540 [Candidatus Desantisbacteria bacterium CG1_02_49_89]|nr:MAG: hypothetical protein AUJ67_06540 [Candidatus Desantisbacteria bacterium CG1_02_49_89]
MKKMLLIFLIALAACGCATTGQQALKEEPEIAKAPVLTGPKKRIAVLDFEDKVPRTQERAGLLEMLFGGQREEQANIGTGMSDMLTTALFKSGKFIVVERQSLQDVMQEQQLGASGMVADQTTTKIGELVGAQVLIKGAVTEFQEKTGGGMGGFDLGPFAMGVQSSFAKVAIDIKLIDAATGVVIEAMNFEKEVTESGLVMAARLRGIKFGGGGFQKTPIGKAVRECIQEAVDYIISKSANMPWQARIALIKEGKIYLNVGLSTGISAGDEFTVYRPGEDIIDPETGMSLGAEENRIGMIRIEEVREKLSIASAVQGSDFSVRDIVRIK